MIAICITILVKHYTTIYTGKVYVFEGLTTIYPYFEVTISRYSRKEDPDKEKGSPGCDRGIRQTLFVHERSKNMHYLCVGEGHPELNTFFVYIHLRIWEEIL